MKESYEHQVQVAIDDINSGCALLNEGLASLQDLIIARYGGTAPSPRWVRNIHTAKTWWAVQIQDTGLHWIICRDGKSTTHDTDLRSVPDEVLTLNRISRGEEE
jgi:hypothetical protein